MIGIAIFSVSLDAARAGPLVDQEPSAKGRKRAAMSAGMGMIFIGSSGRLLTQVIVSSPVTTLFIQALGVNPSRSVEARSVAGFEAVSAGEGVAVLDPSQEGLTVSGGAELYVNGRVVVNSAGKGLDENGQQVDLGNGANYYSASVSGNGTVLRQQRQIAELFEGDHSNKLI